MQITSQNVLESVSLDSLEDACVNFWFLKAFSQQGIKNNPPLLTQGSNTTWMILQNIGNQITTYQKY